LPEAWIQFQRYRQWANPIGGYTVNANPAAFGQSGQRYFDSDISGVIRYNLTAIASVTDQPIQ
jgi:hypothetical protein